MPPVSAGTFATLFGKLDAECRREFVAALYSGRGWDVRVEDDRLHLRRDDETRQTAVLSPPRFRPVSLPDVDEVVVSREHGRLRAATRERGVDYRSPTDLRDLLLYGLDRETAVEIFEEYFDRPLLVADGAEAEEESTLSLTALSTVLGWNARRAGVAGVLLLAIAVVAASGGVFPTLGPESEAPELNQTYTPGQVGAIGGDQPYPPGLGPDGIENSGQLAIAHYEYLNNQSYAYRISASGPQHAPFMLGYTEWNATVRVQDPTHYQYSKRAVAPYGFRVEHRVQADGDNVTVWQPRRSVDVDNETRPAVLEKRVYANGTEKFWRYDGPEQVVYRRASVHQDGGRIFGIVDQVSWVDLYLQQYLWTSNSTVTCLSTTATQDCSTFRVEATGEPQDFRVEPHEFRAVAIVEQPGFVRELTVEYRIAELGNPDEISPVRVHIEYLGVGEGSGDVAPPEWLDTAKDRTDPSTNETETAIGTQSSL